MEFVDRVNLAAVRATTSEDPIKPNQKIEVILNGLPPNYGPIIAALESHQNLDYDRVVSTIQQHDQRRDMKANNDDEIDEGRALHVNDEPPPMSVLLQVWYL